MLRFEYLMVMGIRTNTEVKNRSHSNPHLPPNGADSAEIAQLQNVQPEMYGSAIRGRLACPVKDALSSR